MIAELVAALNSERLAAARIESIVGGAAWGEQELQAQHEQADQLANAFYSAFTLNRKHVRRLSALAVAVSRCHEIERGTALAASLANQLAKEAKPITSILCERFIQPLTTDDEDDKGQLQERAVSALLLMARFCDRDDRREVR